MSWVATGEPVSYLLNLSDTHGWLASVCFDKLIGVVQGPSHLRNYLDTCMPCQFHNLLVPFPRIRIGIFFKDQMRDIPRLEKLYQERLGRFPYHKQF